jgi:hypothetical protein
MFTVQYVAINNHEPCVHVANNTNFQWTRAKSNMPLFRGPAASSHGKGNRRQLMEIIYIARVRIHTPFKIKLIVHGTCL